MKIGAQDDFEKKYMSKFRALAEPYGVFVTHELDRAGRDIGLQLTQPNQTGKGSIVTPALVWFQMKGVMADTLKLEEFDALKEIAIDLEVSHLRFWYLNAQPTYLALYIESADIFFAIDIQRWVEEKFGEDILSLRQKTARVLVHKQNKLDDDFFRLAFARNLIPALRRTFGNEDDASILRFLRDSAIVYWLTTARNAGFETRLTVISWMSKMRTEAYFEKRTPGKDWELFRVHWEYAMETLQVAFPYLEFIPEIKATITRTVVTEDDPDAPWYETVEETVSLIDTATGNEVFDQTEFDGEGLLEISQDEFSYGDVAHGEMSEHRISVKLNDVGERWAKTLDALLEAEVISVEVEPHSVSVAPWHARYL